MHLRRDDRGVTLIEVLVAIVILGIIIVPLGNALIGFSRNTDDTTRRLSESHDAQIMAAYFAQDMQSVGVRDWTADPYPLKQSIVANVAYDGTPYPCGTAGTPPAGTPPAVVRLAWDDPTTVSGAPDIVRVSYVVETVGAERQLHRLRCVGPSPAPADVVLAHNVDASPPSLVCYNASMVAMDCASAPAVPQTVTLTVTIKSPGSSGPALTVTLTGQRRQT
jgi:prepilin-type N-terminal cleavage/methylation domain-containing protein